VALGTVLFADSEAPARVRKELAEEVTRLGFERLEDAVDAAHEAVFKPANWRNGGACTPLRGC
jgi:hypothetical protein